MSLQKWADLHGEDYSKRNRTCMTIYCDYCEQPFEIKEDELDDWMVIDPVSGDKAVMCGECESRRTQRAADGATCPRCQGVLNNDGYCVACGHPFPPRR